MNMTMYQMTEEQLTENANQVKDFLLMALAEEGEISRVVAEDIVSSYAIVHARRGFFGLLVDKILFRDMDKKDKSR